MNRKICSLQQPYFKEDDPWDVFIADDEECDPEPEPGDFWPEDFWFDDDDLPFTDADFGTTLTARSRRKELPCCV